MEEDQKSQVPISADKNCQAKNIKGSVKPKKNMQSEKPTIKSRNKKPIGSNQNCQAESIRRPRKPSNGMQSMTNTEERSAKPKI